MKKGRNIQKMFMVLCCVLGFMVACVHDDNYATPDNLCATSNIVSNTTFEAVKALYQGEILQIQDDLIIEGYVISSDEAGNFFGSIHFQNHPTNPTQGLQLEIDLRELYLLYPVGQKIYLNLKGLYLDNDKETYKLGGAFTAFGNITVGRLPASKLNEHVVLSCEKPTVIYANKHQISALDSTAVNTLVTLTNVEITPESLCATFAEEEETTDHILTDCDGETVVLRNSGFADFQSVLLPLGNGEITGVLTQERNNYVLTIRDLNDVSMNENRCNDVTYFCETPVANTSILSLKEKFQEESTTFKEVLVIETSIIANDKEGNFYKELYVQDSTGGIKISIDETNLFEDFPMYQKMKIAVNGMTLQKINGELTLGVLNNGTFSGIEEDDFYRFFYIENESEIVEPKSIRIDEISEDDIGRLVAIDSVQFVENSTFVVSNKNTNHTFSDCEANELSMRISRRFENANEQIPQGNGKIIGVLQYDENYQIGIRNVDDVSQMVNEPCNVLESATEIALEMLLLQHGNSSEAITENLKITATVTSDYATRNIDSQRMIVQNGNIGVELQLETALEIPIYSEVEIALRGVSIEQTEFGFSFSGITENHILNVVAGEEILPKTISIDELFSEENQYKVIQLNNVQFENTANTFSGENILTNCEMQFPLSVLETATFVNTTVAEGNGTLVGIPYQNRLYVQNLSAFQFTNTYEDCSLQYTSDAIFISEIADPDNNSTAVNMRFIEIYNSSSEAVNLDGWVLRRYTNTNVEFTERSVIDLSGYEILPNATFVIAADAVSFEATYGFTPHLDGGTGGAADSNGDDNIELVDGNGMVVDIFGVVGEDGSGTNHEFEDGRAVRKTSVVKNNSSYTFSEWIIYNDTGDSGTFKEPKTAPQDYTPGVR